MTTRASSTLHAGTPTLQVTDNRGLTVRTLQYHRHPDAPSVTDERITRQGYDARGARVSSADPRLHAAGRVNFTLYAALTGETLRTDSADAGITVQLSDIAGRPLLGIDTNGVIRTWQYEDDTLPGRPLAALEQPAGQVARVTERFVYAGASAAEQALNLARQCVAHYDTAGLVQTDSFALTGVPLSVTRRLLKDADTPNTLADWQGDDASAWNDLLAPESYTTLTTADATGTVLTTTDAAGNRQRVAYDVTGQLAGSWLTLKGGVEQVIVKSLTYSAAGQKLREEHGNGVVTTYSYEPQTRRLTGIKTERPAGHLAGVKVLQDLRYDYDPVGNVLGVRNDVEETRFWRNQKVVPENTYLYDTLYQLISATGREMATVSQQGSSLPAATVPFTTDSAAYTNYLRTYTYDNAGNLTQLRHSAPATGNNYSTDITVSDRSNRAVLSTLTETPANVDALFDAGGNQRQLQPGQWLDWTLRNELQRVAPVVRDGAPDDSESYRYGADSQRLLKVSTQNTGNNLQTQRVLYLPGLELRSTTSGTTETESLQVITVGEARRAQVRVLHWQSGQPAGMVNGQLRYSYDNIIGSGGLEVDGDGKVISLEEYYPYGGTAMWTARSQVEADYKTVRYSGKERDATGLYYYGYRYYQPWAGRWLSSDPAGTVDGLNLFRMVGNNPVTFFDSNGLSRIARINEYAEFIDAAKSSVSKIHTYVDILAHPTRMMAAELRATARRAGTYGAQIAGAVGGAAAGAAIGLTLPVAGPVVISSAFIGTFAGSMIAGKVSEKAFDLGVNAVFEKNKFQTVRVQTRIINDALKQAGGNFFVNTVKGQLDWREQLKGQATSQISSEINQHLDIMLPIKSMLDTGLEIMDFRGLTPTKREKINGILDIISGTLSTDNHKQIMNLFDEKGTASVRKYGVLNIGYLYGASYNKNALSDERDTLLKRVSDIRRMLHNPGIYRGEEAKNLVAREAQFHHIGRISRRNSV